MNKIKSITALLLLVLISYLADAQKPARQVYSMDKNWSFHLGDAEGADKTNFNDNGWRKLNVPHDWSIELPTDENAPRRDVEVSLLQGLAGTAKRSRCPR